MSTASDKYERDVTAYINKMKGMQAARPSVGASYSDVLITKCLNKACRAWVEVKMGHTDNMSNVRVFYQDGEWHTTYKTPVAASTVQMLNESPDAEVFVKKLVKFTGIPEKYIIIPTNKAPLQLEGAVPLKSMQRFFKDGGAGQYVAEKTNVNMGTLITKHYTKGKTEPAYYMQAGDDFYRVSDNNPLNLSTKIPLLSGKGNFRVRVGMRSDFYEIQTEMKIASMPVSDYSVKPGTKKKNPFSPEVK